MQTLQRAVAEIRELEMEEVDLVSGGVGFCQTVTETQTATTSPRTIAAYGELHVVNVQDDMNVTTTTGWGMD